MARSGQFGRLPRQAPDLSGAIAALMRESQAQEDQNFVDAWNKGGEVDGEPVTDARLLAHFKERRDDMTPGTPAWDEWDNRITQYEFAIDESKMMVKWNNEKVSEKDVAAFYKGWLAKTPKNTEFYRHLQSEMGKWRAASSAKGRSSGGRSKAEAHAAWRDNYVKNHVEGAQAFAAGLGSILQIAGAVDPMSNNASLYAINPNSDSFKTALDLIENGSADPSVNDAIKRLTAEIQRTEPDFEWTKSDILAILDEAKRASKVLHKRAPNKTEKDWALQLGKDAGGITGKVNDLDEMAMVNEVAEDFKTRWADCAGDTACQKHVLTITESDLSSLESQLSASNSDPFWTAVIANTRRQMEAGLAGQPAPTGQGGNIFTIQGGGETAPFAGDALSGNLDSMNVANSWLQDGGFITFGPDPSGAMEMDGTPKMVRQTWPPTVPPPAGTVPIQTLTTVDVDDPGMVIAGSATGKRRVFVPSYGNASPVAGIVQSADGRVVASGGAPLFDAISYIGEDGEPEKVYRSVNAAGDVVFTMEPPQFEGASMKQVPGEGLVMVFDAGSNPVTVPDGKGGFALSGDQKYIDGADPHGRNATSGLRFLGSYGTIEGVTTGRAIEKAYHTVDTSGNKSMGSEGRTAGAKAATSLNKLYLLNSQKNPQGGAATDPALKGDTFAAYQTYKLMDAGLEGRALDDALNTRFSLEEDPNKSKYAKELERIGWSMGTGPGAKNVGAEEFARRVDLLAQLDQRETALGKGERGTFGQILSGDKIVNARNAEQEAIDAAQESLLYGTNIRASAIRVPGMDNPFAPKKAATEFDPYKGYGYTSPSEQYAAWQKMMTGTAGPTYGSKAGTGSSGPGGGGSKTTSSGPGGSAAGTTYGGGSPTVNPYTGFVTGATPTVNASTGFVTSNPAVKPIDEKDDEPTSSLPGFGGGKAGSGIGGDSYGSGTGGTGKTGHR